MTKNSDQIEIRAIMAQPIADKLEHLHAEEIDAKIELPSGTVVHITSQFAELDLRKDAGTLLDDVFIKTSSGYKLYSEKLITRWDQIFAESPGMVYGTSLSGEITANSMFLLPNKDTGETHLVFRGDVKFIYKP